MRLTIIGGSQGTGRLLAEAALEAGHDVTVMSRSGTGPAGVHLITGDATDPTAARGAITGSDAVVVTVGAAKGVQHQRASVTRAVVEAMRTEGVRRLLVQSSLGAGDSAAQLPGALRLLAKAVLAKPLADHNEQEKIVQESGLEWTVVRPPGSRTSPPPVIGRRSRRPNPAPSRAPSPAPTSPPACSKPLRIRPPSPDPSV